MAVWQVDLRERELQTLLPVGEAPEGKRPGRESRPIAGQCSGWLVWAAGLHPGLRRRVLPASSLTQGSAQGPLQFG